MYSEYTSAVRLGLSFSGAMLCGLGFISALIVGFLDVRGMKELGLSADIRVDSKKLVCNPLGPACSPIS